MLLQGHGSPQATPTTSHPNTPMDTTDQLPPEGEELAFLDKSGDVDSRQDSLESLKSLDSKSTSRASRASKGSRSTQSSSKKTSPEDSSNTEAENGKLKIVLSAFLFIVLQVAWSVFEQSKCIEPWCIWITNT